MVPLASTRSPFEAQVLAARLGADGIVWQLRGGGADSMYPVGAIDILVSEEDLDRARELLSGDEAGDSNPDEAPGRTEWWFAAVIVVALVLFVALRVLSL
jgi:hypothetical protein